MNCWYIFLWASLGTGAWLTWSSSLKPSCDSPPLWFNPQWVCASSDALDIFDTCTFILPKLEEYRACHHRFSQKWQLRVCKWKCMKWPVAHLPNSTWFWLELVGNCCERLKIIMKCTNIQFCERLGHGWQFHPLKWNFRVCKMPLLIKIPIKMKELGWF